MKKYLTGGRIQISAEDLIGGKVVAVDTRYTSGVPKKVVLEANFTGYLMQANWAELAHTHK